MLTLANSPMLAGTSPRKALNGRQTGREAEPKLLILIREKKQQVLDLDRLEAIVRVNLSLIGQKKAPTRHLIGWLVEQKGRKSRGEFSVVRARVEAKNYRAQSTERRERLSLRDRLESRANSVSDWSR